MRRRRHVAVLSAGLRLLALLLAGLLPAQHLLLVRRGRHALILRHGLLLFGGRLPGQHLLLVLARRHSALLGRLGLRGPLSRLLGLAAGGRLLLGLLAHLI